MTKLVDSYIESIMILQKIPGLALAVLQSGRPQILKGYGYANLEHRVPVSTNTLFQTGSLGNQFTATSAMMLAEQKMLDLDANVGEYLTVPSEWPTITIRQLLNHTSGLRDYAFEVDYRKDYGEDEFLQLLFDMPLEFSPGEDWSYSSTGYALFGMIIKRLTGQHWSRFLNKRIFSRLDMKSACTIDESKIIPNRASGYVYRHDEIFNSDWVAPTTQATAEGSSYVSIIDIANWERGLRGRKLLTADSKRKMYTATTLTSGESVGYGLGWHIGKINGQRVYEHSGTTQGFQTYISRYEDGKITVAILTNQLDARPEVICHSIAALVSDKLRVTKPEPKPSLLPYAELEGEYRMSRGFPVQITARDEGIRVTYGGNITYQLYCADRGIFVDDSGEHRLEFLLDRDSNVSGFKRWASAAGGARSIAKRI